MKILTLSASALSAAAIVAVACLLGGSPDQAAAPAEQPRAARSAAAAQLPVSTDSPASPRTGSSLRVGDTAQLSIGSIALTAMERRGPRAGATLRACVAKDAGAPAAFTLGAWSVAATDGTTLPAVSDDWASVSADDSVPMGGDLVDPAECADLLVTFDLGETRQPVRAIYRNAQGDSFAWVVTPA